MLEAFGGLIFSSANLANLIPNLRLMIFATLIIVFLAPEGLNRPWRKVLNYFSFWPFLY